MSKATPDAPRTIELPVKGMDCAAWDALLASGWRTPRTSLVVWAGQAIYVGMGQSFTLHRHYATQISISLGAPLQMRTCASGPYTEQQSFIVGPNIPHQVKGEGVLYFALWSEDRALADLAHRLSTTSASSLPALPDDLLNALLPGLLASGGQLPEAQAGQALLSHRFAHQTCFANSAHLSRTMRATCGIKPLDLLKRSHLIQVYLLAGEYD